MSYACSCLVLTPFSSSSPSTSTNAVSAPSPPLKQTRQTEPERQSSLPSRYTTPVTSSAVPPVPDKPTVQTSVPESPALTPVAKDPTASTPAVESTSAAGAAATEGEPKKDFSKIGLLPRQSISLLDRKTKDDESDDDLEYVRSPFDDAD